MALRLTTSKISAAGPPAPRVLGARAEALLHEGDHAGYAELFARAAEHEDVHQRHYARLLLLNEGLAAAARLPEGRVLPVYLALARAALDLLEEEPREPTILNIAGVALYEMWSLDAAKALFEAALRLDPRVVHVERNLRELKARRRALSRATRRPVLHASLPLLARRARAVAERARPAKGLTLSLCMIVRDEEEMLPRCLEAVAPAVDEIVIVDTGSTDRTIEIAQSFGARVIERPWTGSFSDARNASFDAATGDWIMYLDADEVLVAEDAQRLREVTGHTWREAFFLLETNYTGEMADGLALNHNALRVFRNRPEYRFSGRLHEQIAHNLPAYLPDRLEHTMIRVEHYGYLGAVRDAKQKSTRNIELLRAQQADGVDTAFLRFNLGSEYAALGNEAAALVELEQSWQMAQRDMDESGGLYEFAPLLTVRLAKSLRACGRHRDAIEHCDAALRRFPGFTDLVYEQGMAAHSMGDHERAIAFYERCMEMGPAPTRYTSNQGCASYLPGIAMAELLLTRSEPQRARELLERSIESNPGFFGTVLPYATALIRCGVEPAEVVGEVQRRLTEATPTVRFMLGTALYEAGAGEEAERQYRLLLERQPHSSRGRVALGEVLLFQRRYADAAREAALMGDDDPLIVMACRTQLFGLLADGDLDGARAALQRARAVELPAHELALFSDWAALVGGEAPARVLPLAAVPLLNTVLEALLRVHDFTNFELVHGLLEHSELSQRERRELLGGMYLRQGFLASAAKEWMAVCEQAPDPRALVGLGQIALLQGQRDDAAVFAQEALALDAGNELARAIAARAGEPATRQAA